MANGFLAGGSGTAADPYLIEDADDFNAIRRNTAACYRLDNHINLGVAPYNNGKGWLPLDGFTGQLDGAGFGIFNVYINRPEEDNVGLFRTMRLTTAQVHSFFIYNAKVIGRTNVGAVLGYGDIGNGGNQQTRVMGLESIAVDNSFVSGEENTGGIIGYFKGTFYKEGEWTEILWSISLFQYLYFNGEIFSKNKSGGIIGTGVVFSGFLHNNPYQKLHLALCFLVLKNIKPLITIDPIIANVVVVKGNQGVGTHGLELLRSTENCFYYCDSIPSSALATKFTQSDLVNTNFDKFNVLKNTQQYRFNFNQMPHFVWMKRNSYYVKMQGKYYTYDRNKQEFIYKYREKDLPKTAELYKNAFDLVDTIPSTAWTKLNNLCTDEQASFDLVNVFPYTEYAIAGTKKYILRRNPAIDETRKSYIFKTELNKGDLDKVLGIYK